MGQLPVKRKFEAKSSPLVDNQSIRAATDAHRIGGDWQRQHKSRGVFSCRLGGRFALQVASCVATNRQTCSTV